MDEIIGEEIVPGVVVASQEVITRVVIHRGREIIVPPGMIFVRRTGSIEPSSGDRMIDMIQEGASSDQSARESAEGYWNWYAMNM
jgi:hypothetical protein